MRQSENHKKNLQLFVKGVNKDLDPKLVGLTQGYYRDSENMRMSSANGVDGSLERVKGETVLYTDITLGSGFTCVGAIEVNYHIVEIWVKNDNTLVVFRIDGAIMVTDIGNTMGLSYSTPLHMHKSDDCNGGEFYFVDSTNPLYIYSVQDIIDNYNDPLDNSKYLSNFNYLIYQGSLSTPLNIMKFKALYDAGGESGLLSGEYSYSIRFVDGEGNRTRFTPPTPLIPVMKSFDRGSSQYPYAKTYDEELETPTSNGIELEYRVNNELNYASIEVRRIAWNTKQAVGYVPTASVYTVTEELIEGEVSIRTFKDGIGVIPADEWLELTDEESIDEINAIETADSVRYFQGYLTLGGIRKSSRDLSSTNISFKENAYEDVAYPFIDDLGDVGHASPYNCAYKKQYMSGERYGFGLACYDSFGNVAFVLPVTGLEDYQFPNRRTKASDSTEDHCVNNWKGMVMACDDKNDTGEGEAGVYVHERFRKKSTLKVTTNAVEPNIDKQIYSPLRPTSFTDTVTTGDTIRMNDYVGGSYNVLRNEEDEKYKYSPRFGLNYYAQGLAITGIDDIPEWVAGFSIVRTQPAGRVVAQGLATYDFEDNPKAKKYYRPNRTIDYETAEKSLKKVLFFSDDEYNGLIEITDSYTAQAVSPLGFFSEMYSGQYDGAASVGNNRMYCKNIDMILYARETFTDPITDSLIGSPSPNLLKKGNGVASYQTKFGGWRAENLTSDDWTSSFGISNVESGRFKKEENTGNNYIKRITFNRNIYDSLKFTVDNSDGGYMAVNGQDTQLWHEPFYIMNILDEGKLIPTTNIQDYILTGHYQKITSVIGKGNGGSQSLQLVDERWEDCIVSGYEVSSQEVNKFIWIKDINGDEKAWIDISQKLGTSEATEIFADLTADGYYEAEVTPGEDPVKCYGVYRSSVSHEGANDIWSIEFVERDSLDNEFTIPVGGSTISVKYDNRFPLVVFGGDSYVGESIFPIVDGISQNDGDVGGDDNDQQLFLWAGMPYSSYKMRHSIMDRAWKFDGDYQAPIHIPCNIIRQMLVTATVETRCNLAYSIGTRGTQSTLNYFNNFPRQNYVIRPIRWDTTKEDNFEAGGGRIHNNYYGATYSENEFDFWKYGGFRFRQVANLDYSQYNSYDIKFAKPLIGFTEETYFCSRAAWSLKRNINQQNDPNLKTFLAENVFDISDNMGAIKYLYDNNSQKGNNLFAITERGICLLLTDKRIVSQIDGNELLSLPADKLVTGEYWLSKDVGCNDENWRSIAENNNNLFFSNNQSVYKLAGLELMDIGRENKGGYYSKLNPALLSVEAGFTTKMNGVYDILNNEYWLSINDVIYVFKDTPNIFAWGGTLTYAGDKFICARGINGLKNVQMLSFADLVTYKLNEGTTIGSSLITGKVDFIVSPDGYLTKEFIDQTYNSSLQPTIVRYTTDEKGVFEGTQAVFKNYTNAYYTMIPRKSVGNTYRFQNQYVLCRVECGTVGDFIINTIETGFKIIK